MVLELVKIFDGSFGGPVLYENSSYVSPNLLRRRQKQGAGGKYLQKLQSKKSLEVRRELEPETVKTDPLDDIFQTPKAEKDSDADENDIEGGELAMSPDAKRLKLDIERPRNRKTRMNKRKRKGRKSDSL